jgi:hypothetical protein
LAGHRNKTPLEKSTLLLPWSGSCLVAAQIKKYDEHSYSKVTKEENVGADSATKKTLQPQCTV